MKNASTLALIGGFGFIGRNILEALSQDPGFDCLSPIVVDNLSNPAPGHEDQDVAHCIGDYNDPQVGDFLNAHKPTNENARVFVFLAGETRVAESKDRPLDFIEANITAPSAFVMENVTPGDAFILVSTAGALFDGTFEVRTDSAYCPKNFYGASKAAEEMILEKLVELRGGTFKVVRLTNVYGKYSENKKSAIHAFTRAAIAGDEVFINGDGKQSRDFIYAGDVGYGIATLAKGVHDGADMDKVNMLGSGVSTSLMDVVASIEQATGKTLAYKRVEAKELLKSEPRDVIANPDDVKALLGERTTPFVEGIGHTYRYYSGQ